MKYAHIVFLQCSEDTEEPERIFREEGPSALLEYLKQWDFGPESETDIYNIPCWGESDQVFFFGEYVVTVNLGLPHFGLARALPENSLIVDTSGGLIRRITTDSPEILRMIKEGTLQLEVLDRDDLEQETWDPDYEREIRKAKALANRLETDSTLTDIY